MIHDVDVRLAPPLRTASEGLGGSRTVGLEQRVRVRVRLARPWFSSGEGERIALVLWPPNIFARGTGRDDVGRDLPSELLDADLGPGGAYVTRWAEDPNDAEGAPLGELVPSDALALPDADPAALVATAFMPLPSGPADPGGVGQPDFMAVALLTAEPRFDVEEELWYIDVELKADLGSDPYLRLGLVRYQPHAREDFVPPEGGEPVRLRVSTPVTARAPVLQTRRADATWRTGRDGTTEVFVTVLLSRPEGVAGPAGAGPAVRISVVRERRSDGQRASATGTDGEACTWLSWEASEGSVVRRGGGSSWTCRFALAGAVEDARWTTVVLMETFSRRPPATYGKEPISATGDPTLVESGPDFIGVLRLRTGVDEARESGDGS